MNEIRRWILPTLLVVAAMVYMTVRAVPLMDDGSQDPRHAHFALNDEGLILEGVWSMVERGDINYGIAVYPGLYPYLAAGIRILFGPDSQRTILATRWFSYVTMCFALLVPYVLFGMLLRNPWPAAVFTAALAVNPETILWAARIHPDALLTLLNHTALAALALSVQRGSSRWLWLATIAASLSAGTKLVGLFIFPVIVAWIAWDNRRNLKRGAMLLAGHVLIFVALFLVTNPRFAQYPVGMIHGWRMQHQRNVLGGGGVIDWWNVLVGGRGIGWAGLVALMLGMFRLAADRGRKELGLLAITAFACFYSLFLLSTVKLVLPRYGSTSMWPLCFVGLAALRPSVWRNAIVPWTAIGFCFATYLWHDWSKMQVEREDDYRHYELALPPETLAFSEHIVAAHTRRPGIVLTSPFVFVPQELRWVSTWSLDHQPEMEPVTVIVLDRLLRDAKGERYQALMENRLGFVATATVGDRVLYERRP